MRGWEGGSGGGRECLPKTLADLIKADGMRSQCFVSAYESSCPFLCRSRKCQASLLKIYGAVCANLARCHESLPFYALGEQSITQIRASEMFIRFLASLIAMAPMASTRYIMYLTGFVSSIILSSTSSSHDLTDSIMLCLTYPLYQASLMWLWLS